MIYNNEFDCPDGHKFKANAKLRARCPDCGKMARRSYAKVIENITPIGDGGDPVSQAGPPPSPPEHKTGVKLIRSGRPKASIMPKRTTPPKDEHGKFVSTAKKAMPKNTSRGHRIGSTVHRSTDIVRKHKVTAKKVMPKVTRRPPRTAVARHVIDAKKSYADEMMEQYGFRR